MKLLDTDMHIHTTASDGEYSSLDIYQKIKETEQITTFAITDHDNILGAKSLQKYLKANPDDNINYIPGIEMTASVSIPKYKANKGQLHILGYDFDLENSKLQELINRRKQITTTSLTRQLEELNQIAKIRFKEPEIKDMLKRKRPNRVDIAKLLMKHGYVRTIKEAFDKYLQETYERIRKDLPKIYEEEIIQAIKTAGGYVSLAHPTILRLDLKTLKEYITYLQDLGLDAIEVYHSNQKRKYSKELNQIAKEQDLYISGGSDYHGPQVKPNVHLGLDKGHRKEKVLTLQSHILKSRK